MPGAIPFGTEFLVNTTTVFGQFDPTITALADGRFVVAWTDNSQSGGDTSGFAVRAQMFNADGSPSGAEFLVNTTTTNDQDTPTITALAGGGFVAAWRDDSQSGGDVNSFAVRAQIFDAGGSPSGAEFLVNTKVTQGQFEPSITALPDGRFVAAWRDGGSDPTSGVRAQVFNADGSKSGAELLVNTTTTNSQEQPTITALADGRFVVAWADESASGGDTSSFAVRAQVFNTDGTPSGTELLVNTTTTNIQDSPTITSLADGRFVVVWEDASASGGDTSSNAVRAQMFNADGSTSGAEFLVNSTTASNQSIPTIAALADGRFVVAWADFSQSGGDTSGFAVRAQVFNTDGSKSGAEFLVNTTTFNVQNSPTIAALADGRFAVAWHDSSGSGGDTSNLAVRGQIFDPREEALILSGTALGDDFVGTGFGDFIDGSGGDDKVDGAGGNDMLRGGAGDDTVNGGNGNDSLDGGNGNDALNGGAGNDTYVLADATADTIADASGTDIVTSTVTRSLASFATVENLTLLGTAAIDGTGNGLANTVTGNAGANTLSGGIGNDILDGGLGLDTLLGGADNDTYVLGSGNDAIADTSGSDTITSTITRSLAGFGTIENLTLTGGNLNGTGNSLANTIKGTAGANILDGGLGQDRLEGGAGNDTYIINLSTDVLVDTGGVDTVRSTVTKTLATGFESLILTGTAKINGTGNSVANTITGNSNINKLLGLSGNDTLNSGSGNDILTGGLGRDIMTGGAGPDRFDFNLVTETGKTSTTRDIITDFAHNSDDIDLATIDANGSASGNGKFAFLAGEGAAFTGVHGQLRWDQQNLTGTANDKTVVEGDINGDKKADFQIQLTGIKVLSATDFIL
ncbi:MAG: beta strand repeat-containing protein [Xanthobacteraceae bacterium]